MSRLGHHVPKRYLPIITFGVEMFRTFVLIAINSGDSIIIDAPLVKEDLSADIVQKRKVFGWSVSLKMREKATFIR